MRLLTAALAATAALIVPLAPSSEAAGSCRHLITDPAGDVNPLSSPPGVDDTNLVDLTAVDLKTDRKNVSVQFSVVDINDERTNVLRHSFAVWFGSAGKRYALTATREPDGDAFEAWIVTAGQDYSEQENAGYAWAESGLGEVTGSFDAATNTVKVTAPLDLFKASGGLKRELTEVHAISWTGVGAAGGGAESGGDETDRVPRYVMGKPSCVR